MKKVNARSVCPKCGAHTYIYNRTECAVYLAKGEYSHIDLVSKYPHGVIEVTCVVCGYIRVFLPLDHEPEVLSVCKPEDELGYCPRCHTRNTTDTPRRDGVLDCVCNECGAKYTETPSEL